MIDPVWARVRLGPDAARARLDGGAQTHVYAAPPGAPRLVWIAVDADTALHQADCPGGPTTLPVPTGTFLPDRPTRGEIRHRDGARRYAPYWIFGDGDDVAIVDAVEGRLAGSVTIDARAGARFLIGLTLALLFIVVIGLEIIEALLTLGVLLPLRFVFIGAPQSETHLAFILAAFGALCWFGRRTLEVTRPLLAEAGHRMGTRRVDLAQVYARPAVIWARGWLTLFIALRLLTRIFTDDLNGLAACLALAAAGVCGIVWRTAVRWGARPTRASPWRAIESEIDAPPLLRWAHLTLRIALFGVSASCIASLVSASELVHRMGLWVLDLGPGVADHVVAGGVALGMWTGERRFRKRKTSASAEPVAEADRPSTDAPPPELQRAEPLPLPSALPPQADTDVLTAVGATQGQPAVTLGGLPSAAAHAPETNQAHWSRLPTPETSEQLLGGSARRRTALAAPEPMPQPTRTLHPRPSTHIPMLDDAAPAEPVPQSRALPKALVVPPPDAVTAQRPASPAAMAAHTEAGRARTAPQVAPNAEAAQATASQATAPHATAPQATAPQAAAPRIGLSVKTLLAALAGSQIGAIIMPGLAVIGLGVGGWGALWAGHGQSGLTPRQRWAAWGALIAGAGIGQAAGTVVGTFLMGVAGAEAGAEIGEWTMASAALTALIHAFNTDAPPPTATPPEPAPGRTDREASRRQTC